MRTPVRAISLALCCAVLLSFPSSAAILRVKSDAPGPAHDGTSWTAAFTAVQPAITAASSGDEVWVAKGTYTGVITMKSGVALYGGFTGTESAREGRDWKLNESILDGTTFSGATRLKVSAVTFPAYATESTILDGFTVTKGNGTRITIGSSAYIVGGGIYVPGGSPVIRNNRITGNSAEYEPEGINIGAMGSGGGIYIQSGTPRIEANCIEANTTSEPGGGICAVAGAPLVLRNVIANNSSFWSVRMNMGGSSGGVHMATGGVLDGNVITGNSAPSVSGVYMNGGRCINNTFAKNKAGFGGGVTSLEAWGSSVVVNNVFAYDDTIRWREGTILTHNCVFLNDASLAGQLPPGNLLADPLFVDAVNGDFHVRSTSPCRDAGDGANASVNPVDMDGEARISGARIDIGADECVLLPGQVVWVTPPSSTRANVYISPAPSVRIVDGAGQTITGFNGPVTLAIQPGTGAAGAALSGNTAAAVNGVATFTSLAVTAPGRGYVLVPSARTLYGEDLPYDPSAPFDVYASATHLVFRTQPQGTSPRVPLSPTPVVAAVDDAGVVVPEFTGAITLSIKSGTGTSGATLTGTVTVNAVNGLATFSGVSINRTGAGYVLIASTPLLTSGESAPVSLPTSVPIKVSTTGNDLNSGVTWGSAFRTVQAALDAAAGEGGAEVWVAKGAYTGNFTVKAPTALFGGFSGTEASRDSRNAAVNPTVFDAGKKGRVLTVSGPAGSYVVDGFTIRNGNMDGSWTPAGQERQGAGIASYGRDIRITYNLFEANVVAGDMQPGPQGYGSAVYVSGGPAVISDNVFRQNNASADVGISVGGTVFGDNATLTIERNVFIDNNRGAVKWANGSGIVRSNLIVRCGNGSAIEALGPGQITNNTIVGTEYPMGYGAVLIGDASAVLSNNVIAYNTAGVSLNYNVTKPTLHDNCLFGNAEGNYVGFSYPDGQDPNLLADPLLVDRAAGNFHLQASSPCIDTGDDAVYTVGELDLDGNPRKLGAHVDIGAYEFVPIGHYTLVDAQRALRIAAGLASMTAADAHLGSPASPEPVTLADVIAILRQVTSPALSS